MRKIVGVTVGMGLPKPDLRQTDPKKGDYVKGKEDFALKSDIPSGMSSSWNDLTDKPFTTETVYYEWDINKEYVDENRVFAYVKLSNDVPEKEFFIGKTVKMALYVDGEYTVQSGVITEDSIHETDGAFAAGEAFMVVTVDSLPINDVMSLTKGVWTLDLTEQGGVNTKLCEPCKPLDESVIPDTIARKNDLSWGNLLNKPFDDKFIEVIPKREYTYLYPNPNDIWFGHYLDIPDEDFGKIEEGKSYTVYWGLPGDKLETYTCVAQYHENSIYAGVLLGNPLEAGDLDNDNGLPFTVQYRENEDGTVYKRVAMMTDSYNKGVFGVYENSADCLDEKYIPDTIARISDVERLLGVIENGTY